MGLSCYSYQLHSALSEIVSTGFVQGVCCSNSALNHFSKLQQCASTVVFSVFVLCLRKKNLFLLCDQYLHYNILLKSILNEKSSRQSFPLSVIDC